MIEEKIRYTDWDEDVKELYRDNCAGDEKSQAVLDETLESCKKHGLTCEELYQLAHRLLDVYSKRVDLARVSKF